MRLSLSADVEAGSCSGCQEPAQVVRFSVVAEGGAGDIAALCARCLFHPNGAKAEVTLEPLAPGPAPRRRAMRKNKRTSEKQERELAEELGGRRQPGSGNQAGAAGDVRSKGRFRLEAKFTSAASFSLQLDELEKIAGEAETGEIPLFVVDYIEPGTRKLKGRYAVVHFTDLKGMLDAARPHR